MRTGLPYQGQKAGRRGGLVWRVVLAGGLMVLAKITIFGLMFGAITGLDRAQAAAQHSDAVLTAAGRLDTLLVDLDADSRGFVLTRDRRLTQAYDAARAAVPARTADLRRLSAKSGDDEAARANQIAQATDSYLRDYSVPLMRSDPALARSTLANGQGARRLASLREQLTGLGNAERTLAATKTLRLVRAARTNAISAATSTVAALLLTCVFMIYVIAAIIRPVHRASVMAGELAEGDLAVRTPETSRGTIGELEGRLNTMAGSLETSRDELRQFAEEQGALRRVATLVAGGVASSKVFAAVATEVGRVLRADHANIIRYEPDSTVTTVGYWNSPAVPTIMPPLRGCWPVEEGTVTSAMLTTERPARMTDYEHATSAIGMWTRANGIRCVVGCPVKVEGRIWGAILIYSLDHEPEPGATENRLQEFVELVGTAIANAQVHTDLLASRARVVAAADESRRRIERDLHDGTQQQLVTLALQLRMLESTTAPCQERLRGQLSGAVDAASGILDDVQRISRGIVPPILTTGGLGPALLTLARRSAVPTDLDVRVVGRLPERVEVAIYYAISEALTNVVKHAHASTARVRVTLNGRTVKLSVRDDGIGGAGLCRGTGLVGLKDRIEALGGRVRIISPSGDGTSLLADIPADQD